MSGFRARVSSRLRYVLQTGRELSEPYGPPNRDRWITYAAIERLSDRYRDWSVADAADLRLSEARVFSQNGEDGIICALLKLTGGDVGGPVAPFFVEFGGGDGSENNTRFLAEILG